MQRITIKSPMDEYLEHKTPIEARYNRVIELERTVYLGAELAAKKVYEEAKNKALMEYQSKTDEARSVKETEIDICKQTYYSDEVREAWLNREEKE